MELKKLNADAFDKVIYDDYESCLVVFSRKSCHVCKEVVPMVEETADKYQNKLGFYIVDVEEEKGLYHRFSLKGVPTLLFFKDGEYQGKLAGNVDEDELKEKIVNLLL